MMVCLIMPILGSPAVAAENEYGEIGSQAYIYAFPMVWMEITRRSTTNVAEAGGGASGLNAPMNRFSHVRDFPDHTFTDVVRPNADTLYSCLWFDVSKEPLVLSVADTKGRYFLLPILDMWTDVIACPGSRTTGTGNQTYAIVGPNFQGSLPRGIEPIRCPTGIGWIIGRTQTNGKADYGHVHQIQAGYTVAPLSQWGKNTAPAKGIVNPDWDTTTPPLKQVLNMETTAFFQLFAEPLKDNPPHEMDWNMVAQLKQIGMVPGQSFDDSGLTDDQKKALDQAAQEAKKLISKGSMGEAVNGWSVSRDFMGTYVTSYLHRAVIAMMGLGANLAEDAVYPLTQVDSGGNPYNGANTYVIHFDKGALPPVKGFWSLTMYNEKMLFVENPVGRYAIGDRDKLELNPDGSLDIIVQHASPGKDKEANWLPAPEGKFDMLMRLYWPDMDVLTGAWAPPAVQKTN